MDERKLTMAEAMREALKEEMEEDPRIFIMGEDIRANGGIWTQFKGLPEEFPNRVIDTPISETAIVGAGTGAALTGMRPFVDMHFADFMMPAMDEIVNQAAKMPYMFGGQCKMPLVIWAPDGGGLSGGPHHSQSLEAWFIHSPGAKVIAPSTPHDTKGLLKTALRDDDLVIFFQHKRLFESKGIVPKDEYTIPLGQADIKREGSDLTIVTYSRMVLEAQEAAEEVAKDGISVEIVDLRTIWPLDLETIANSVKKTGYVLVVHEAWKTGGVGAEISSQIQEHSLSHLNAPIIRLGAKHIPIPFSPPLEKDTLPDSEDIVEAIYSL